MLNVLFLTNSWETYQWLLNMYRTSSIIRKGLPDSTALPHYFTFLFQWFQSFWRHSAFYFLPIALISYFCATLTICLKITCNFLTKPQLTLAHPLSVFLQYFNGFDSPIHKFLLHWPLYIFFTSDFPDALSNSLNPSPPHHFFCFLWLLC